MKNYQKLFWLMLALLTVLRLIFIGLFELCPDEAYYWTWSRHLDWSYYDQGPMLALVIRFFTSLTGMTNEWSVRLGSVVLSFLTAWMFFDLVRRLFQSSRTAWYAFLGLQSALLFSVGAVLMMHDSIMLSAWIGALWCFYRALFEDWKSGWILGALAVGFGVLSKYTMLMFIPSLALFLLCSPPQRVWWRRPQPYLAGLIVLVMVLPIILWNAAHGWASFGHIGNLAGAGRDFSLSLKTVFHFLGGQLGVMTPLLGAFCLAAPLIAWQQWRKRNTDSQNFLFLACFSGPILIFFLMLSFHKNVYANWPAPAYPASLAILAGWAVQKLAAKRRLLTTRWILAVLLSAALLTLTVHLESAWSVLPLKGRAAQSMDRIRGWSGIGTETGRRLEGLNKSGGAVPFLAARRYQLAGILSFYTPGRPEVQLFARNVPARNQYRFWNRAPELYGRDALYVCEHAWEIDHIRSRFLSLEPLEPFIVRQGPRLIREIRFYHAHKFLRPPENPDKQRSEPRL